MITEADVIEAWDHRLFENKADWIAECTRLHQPVIFQDNTELQCIMAFHAANAFIGKIMDTDCELIGVWYNNDWTNKSHWVHRSIRNTQP